MRLLSPNLLAFEATARNEAVHRAAQELGLTQTGVTQRLKSLEKDLGVTLFTRSRKGMRLTAEGESLLRYCQSSQELEGEVLSRFSGQNKQREINVHFVGPTSATISRFTKSCLPLYLKWPNLYLHFQVDDHADRVNLVRTGKAHIAVVKPEQVPREMDSKVLRPDRFCLVATAKWKNRELEEILKNERIIDFYENDPTTLNYLAKFNLHKKVGRPRLFVNNNRGLVNFFIEGVGYGTLAQEIAQPYLDSGQLVTLNKGQVLEEPLALVWYPRPQMPDYLKAIIKSVK